VLPVWQRDATRWFVPRLPELRSDERLFLGRIALERKRDVFQIQ
jgi:hypothetical protein